jgi:hypothetical protein
MVGLYVFDIIFHSISVTLWQSVLFVKVIGVALRTPHHGNVFLWLVT